MKLGRLSLLLVLALAGCGDFPRPFQGNPGVVGAHLVIPPPPLLAVPQPRHALLPADANARFAHLLATALADRTVPAVAEAPAKGDWRLEIGAIRANGDVIPRYTVFDPALQRQGSIRGKPVSATIWTKGEVAGLRKVANRDAQPIAALLTTIDARIKRSNPQSLMNRPARVYFAGVIDAPGDGDLLLAGAMRRDLPSVDVDLTKAKRGADFTVLGKVKVTPATAVRKKVELQWVVTDAEGRERGRVVQLNEVAAHTIEPSWASVAPEIAQQAAGGLHDLIEKARKAP